MLKSKSGRVLLWVASVLIAALIGWIAAVQVTRPPQLETAQSEPVTVQVSEGSLQVEQSYGIEADWVTSPIGVNQFAGIVTKLGVAPGGTEVSAGTVVYSVDMRPVVVAVGEVPNYRELALGAEGEDVRQLQVLLDSLNFSSEEPNGTFSAATQAAVSAWNAELGLGPSVSVPAGQIIFVPSLPAVIAPGPDVLVGSVAGGGQSILIGATAAPVFSFRVLPEAVERTVPGLAVQIQARDQQWAAEVDRLEQAPDDTGATIAVLRPTSDQTSICAPNCSSAVALGAKTVLPSQLLLVPEVSGAEVPTAAIVTTTEGATEVVLENGDRVPVDVVASDQGRSIVEGVDVGERIRVLGARE